jgi:uncharacterized protein YjiS (DUF1127 family)
MISLSCALERVLFRNRYHLRRTAVLLASFIISPLSALLKGTVRTTRKAAAQAVRGVKRVATVWRHRREVTRLTELSAHELKDIGLVRSDVLGALEGHWLDDPSMALTARSARIHGNAAARRDEGLRRAGPLTSSQDSAVSGETCLPRGV